MTEITANDASPKEGESQKTASYTLGAVVFVLAAATAFLAYRLFEQSQQLIALETSYQEMQQQNARILSYMENQHGSDQERDAERERIKILLEDHEAKIFNIVKTINELH